MIRLERGIRNLVRARSRERFNEVHDTDDEKHLLHHDKGARGLGFRTDIAEANGGLNGKREIDCIDERRVFVQAREMRITDFREDQIDKREQKNRDEIEHEHPEHYYKGDILIDAALAANHEAKSNPGGNVSRLLMFVGLSRYCKFV